MAAASLGRYCGPRAVSALDEAVNHLAAGEMLDRWGIEPAERVADRAAVFGIAVDALRGPKPVYLEFGVARGSSMAYWSRSVEQPAAELHGFDSFLGLPEDWAGEMRRGAFTTGGSVPPLDDERIVWHAGWFEDVLPAFDIPPHDQLVVNIDCDLYSSSSTVLRWLVPHLRPGDLLYFDELHDRANEGRAFQEHVLRAGVPVRCLASSRDLVHVLFRVEGGPPPSRAVT